MTVNKSRLSATQKDVLFVLAKFVSCNKKSHIPAAIIKTMIDSSRASPLNRANYLKGIHALSRDNRLSVVRAHDLSLRIKLSDRGFPIAAQLFEDRTGSILQINSDNEQLDLVNFIANN